MCKKIKSLTVITTISLLIISGPLFSQAGIPLISDIVAANSRFGIKLFNEIFEQNSESNILISPLSISLALTMCYNGAVGEIEKAMAQALELQNMSLESINQANQKLINMLINLDSDVQLNLANSLWADKQVRFKEDFMSMNKKFYGAEITNLDLRAISSIHRINQWIKERTQGTIQKMLSRQDLDAILFILNAIYFKAAWRVGFSKEHTQERDFTLLDGRKITVPMMMSQSDQYKYFEGDDFQGVELSYGIEKMSLYLLLPDENSSLKTLQKKLTHENWEFWLAGFHKDLVMVTLPRFKLEFDIKLNEVLKALGMGIAFAHQANFTKMCYGGPVLDWVKHQAFLEVNEEGTEAAAVTVVKQKKGGLVELLFDRPFFLVIRDNVTGTILFMGTVVEPRSVNVE